MTKHSEIKKNIILTGDIILIVCSLYVAFSLRFHSHINVFAVYTGASIFTVIGCLLSFYIFDLYDSRYKITSFNYLVRYLLAIIAAALLIAVIFYFAPPVKSQWKFGRGIYLISIGFIAVSAYIWRLILNVLFLAFKKPRRIIIVGAGASGKTIYHELQNSGEFDIVGFLDNRHQNNSKKIGSHRVLGGNNLLAEMVDKDKIDVAVVSLTYKNDPDLIKDLLYSKVKGVEIYDIPHLYEELTAKMPVQYLTDGRIAYTTFLGLRKNVYTTRIKPQLDQFLAFIGLLLSLPIIIITAMAIEIDSPGPIFYRQKRVGLDGRVFELIKFRSMIENAESKKAVWALENDPRVTRVGKIIRKIRVDEIPQMWNILSGEMSFIGPRPERPEFVQQLVEELPFYAFRHSVKPGLTGWAQVTYRYGASKEDALEKLQYDLYYIKNLSLLLDLNILLRTSRVVLFGKGAR